MVEAKASKLREYFTNTIQHTETKPSDQSGKQLFVGFDRRNSSIGKKSSPVRFNNTYRSNFSFGHNDDVINATPLTSH